MLFGKFHILVIYRFLSQFNYFIKYLLLAVCPRPRSRKISLLVSHGDYNIFRNKYHPMSFIGIRTINIPYFIQIGPIVSEPIQCKLTIKQLNLSSLQ